MMNILLAVASSILLIFSFPNFNLGFLAWIALVPLFYALENQKPLKAFLISYLTGIIFFLGTMYWLIHVTLPGMIIVVLYLALYFGLFGLILAQSSKLKAQSLLFFAPASWVALEWIRSTGGAGLGWVLLGHSQSINLPIIQIADITGAYGVSFLVVMVNAVIFLGIKKAREWKTLILPASASIAIIFIALAYGNFRLNNIFTGDRLKVAVIQGNIPQADKWDLTFRDEILNKYALITRDAAREGQDLIIWPETSVPGFLESERSLLDAVRYLAISVKTPLLVGTVREDKILKDVYYNSATLFLEDGRISGTYDKMHLVPFGEYIPFKRALSFVEKFAQMPIGDITSGKDYTVFKFFIERTAQAKDFNWRFIKRVKLSCLICFEDIFPGLARRFVKEGALFLVNITNDAWYKDTSAAYQHAQNSVFRAVENRVNIVRAANTGLSCFIDQKGRMTAAVEVNGRHLFVDGYKSREITLTSANTFYTRHGDIFAYLCILLSAFYILKTALKRKTI